MKDVRPPKNLFPVGRVGKKKYGKKSFQSALFSPPGQWTGNDFLFKGSLIIDTYHTTGVRIQWGENSNTISRTQLDTNLVGLL